MAPTRRTPDCQGPCESQKWQASTKFRLMQKVWPTRPTQERRGVRFSYIGTLDLLYYMQPSQVMPPHSVNSETPRTRPRVPLARLVCQQGQRPTVRKQGRRPTTISCAGSCGAAWAGFRSPRRGYLCKEGKPPWHDRPPLSSWGKLALWSAKGPQDRQTTILPVGQQMPSCCR